MTFGMAYATRRPHCIGDVVKMWKDRAFRKDHKWCIGADMEDRETISVASEQGLAIAADTGEGTCVKAWNIATKMLTMGSDPVDVVVAVSDDFVPPHQWDVGLAQAIHRAAKTDFVVHVHDGGEGSLCTLPVVAASRIRRFGYFYHPGYKSMFADTELTARAYLDGSLVDAKHLLFEHMHPVNRKRPKDSVDEKHASQSRWDEGKALFSQRFLLGFPPLGKDYDELPAEVHRYCASLQVTRDDICLAATVLRLFTEGVRNFAFNCPKQHWDGSEVPQSDHDQVVKIAKELIGWGAHYVRVFQDSLAPYYWPGMSRSTLETNYRNSCLERLRILGFREQLIIDGDEIVLPRALQQMDWHVRWFRPHTAALRGVPVAGCPGVPIDGAADRILCYMGPEDKWRDVRSPHKPTLDIGRFGVLHLSAVRRTRDELIAKMRRSGHYDDPDYRFEEWIEKVLPELKPGMWNVHMYRDGSLWPLTREFTEEEWSAIPNELKPLMWGGK